MSFNTCFSHSVNYDEFIKLKWKTQHYTNVLLKPVFGSSATLSKKTPSAKVSIICNNDAPHMIYGHQHGSRMWRDELISISYDTPLSLVAVKCLYALRHTDTGKYLHITDRYGQEGSRTRPAKLMQPLVFSSQPVKDFFLPCWLFLLRQTQSLTLLEKFSV